MSLLLNLLKQLLEYYGVPPELLLRRCKICLNRIAHMIGSHLSSNTLSRTHFQHLCAISRSCLISWAWERKEYGSTRSFIRRLGNCLLLTPTPRPHFPMIQSLNSLESDQSYYIAPSLADVLWMADDDRAQCAKFRYDEWREVVTPSTLPAPVGSKEIVQKTTVVNEDAFQKISALENELAHLRRQIASIVAADRTGNDQSRTMKSHSGGLPQPTMTSSPVPVSLCNVVVPPAPPPPPLPSNLDSCNSAIELIKQRRAANPGRHITESVGWKTVKTAPSMMDVLKDMKKVKLRTVERSPGGTPLPKTKKIMQSSWDPAALIAEALKEKFASQSNGEDSFDKENRSYGASPFSSPDTPVVGCRILKPSMKQTYIRAEELTHVSATKTGARI
ncbi:mitochondrial fission regulator 2 [Varanus komodoensis]|uniref:mitochondrial fission regulator 2 n=1 Tax=Varanus komodoensis TaxID=61221 RepID=UPI001CF7E741|nr:mitochondrial fission regulator 2 [Varanus komodoensis]